MTCRVCHHEFCWHCRDSYTFNGHWKCERSWMNLSVLRLWYTFIGVMIALLFMTILCIAKPLVATSQNKSLLVDVASLDVASTASVLVMNVYYDHHYHFHGFRLDAAVNVVAGVAFTHFLSHTGFIRDIHRLSDKIWTTPLTSTTLNTSSHLPDALATCPAYPTNTTHA